MNFKSNLLYGLGLALLVLLASSVASYISITNLIKSSTQVKKSNETIQDISTLFSLVKDVETAQRGYLLTRDTQFLPSFEEGKKKISTAVEEVRLELSDSDKQRANFQFLSESIQARVKLLDQNIALREVHGGTSTLELMEGKTQMDNIRSAVVRMQREEQALLQKRTNRMDSFASYTPLLIVASALLAFLITFYFFRKINESYKKTLSLSQEVEKKNEESENRLLAIGKVAEQISSGDYNIKWDQNMQNTLGTVAISLNRMSDSLDSSFKLLEDKQWLSSASAQLSERMLGEKSLETLSNEILEFLTSKTKSFLGAIYLLEEEDHQLHLKGSFALDSSAMQRRIAIGEGLLGQAFQSRNEILVQEFNENSPSVTYSSGKTLPTNLLILPLTRHNMPLGVLEIASTHTYCETELEFLRSAAGTIGLSIFDTQNRIRLQELLEETQAQSEELMSQQSELENINSELEAQSQKLLASEEELRVQQEELLQSNQELEERTSLLEEQNELIEQRNLDIQQKSIALEQSTRYKSEFLANMSHELRTPLNSILLLSKLMTETEELEEQYVEYASVIHSSGQGLLTLIDEILDLSKIESGKMNLELHTVHVKEITHSMQMLFGEIAKEKNLKLEIKTKDLEIETLYTDRLRVEQILRNLLSNALKFTSEGTVTLDISSDKDQGQVHFKVSDTGIGIAKNKIQMVFEAFQQADGSTQRKYGGTGLGLSISRELSKLLGGEITLSSKEGKGSTFTLIIPINATEVSEVPQEQLTETFEAIPTVLAPKEPTEEGQQRYLSSSIPKAVEDDRDTIQKDDKIILIIEDDTSFAKILLDYARKKGYKGLVSVRGDQGIELAEHYNPLAILLDIQLPIMDGWQVMEALKSNPKTKPIPVHIMSSMKFKHESLLRGAVDFINKPFALEQMQVIFNTLEKAISRSPKKVLIVEENPQHAKALSYFLSTNSISNTIATNVDESIDSLTSHKVDCVILDMGVPDRLAYETLETIKEQEGLEKLPIIVFTGKNLSKGEETRIKKYADSIVVKTAHSYQRILDEAGLFLHLVEEKNKKDKKQSSADTQSTLRNILKDKTVLLADDDVRNIFSLTKALELHGMNVLPALDGKEALKTLDENSQIDIVLMDMMMPEMDGYETIGQIRTNPSHKTLPILAVTSKAMMGDREKCIAAGASDYISKPVDIDQLISLLRVWLYDRT
ncbi:response regulator [Chryseobacterium sp. A301]